MPWGSSLQSNYFFGYFADKVISSFAGGGARARKAYSVAKSISVNVAKGGRAISGELSSGVGRRMMYGAAIGGTVGGLRDSYNSGQRPRLGAIARGAGWGAGIAGGARIARNAYRSSILRSTLRTGAERATNYAGKTHGYVSAQMEIAAKRHASQNIDLTSEIGELFK